MLWAIKKIIQFHLKDLRDTIDVPQDGSGVQYYQGKELWTQVIMEEVFIPGKLTCY